MCVLLSVVSVGVCVCVFVCVLSVVSVSVCCLVCSVCECVLLSVDWTVR